MSPVAINGATHGVHAPNGVLKGPHDGFGTRAIHVGSEPNPETGAVIPSISLSTTYKQDGVGNHKVRFLYLRCDLDLTYRRGLSIRGQETRIATHSRQRLHH